MSVTQNLYVNETSYSIADNKSIVNISWTSTQSGESHNDNRRTAYYYIAINGGSESTHSVEYTLPSNQTRTIVNTSIEVPHRNDGTASITVRTWMDTRISAGTIEKRVSINLTNIPRAAQVTSAQDFNNGNTPQITFDNPAGFQVRPYITFYNSDNYLVHRMNKEIGNYSSPYTFVITDEERAEILKSCNQQGVYECWEGLETFNNGAYVGYHSLEKKFTIVEDQNTKPSLTVQTSIDNGSAPAKFNDICIQGVTRVDVTLTASGKYNSNIQSYSSEIDGQEYQSAEFKSDVLQNIGEQNITFKVTDSRGFTTQSTDTINVIGYAKPLVIPIGSESSILCYRSDELGNRVSNSTTLWLKAKRSYSKIAHEGTNLNSCTLSFRYKLSSEQWDARHEWHTLIGPSVTTTDEWNALLNGYEFSLHNSYTIQIQVTDEFGNTDEKTVDIPTQDVALHLAKGGKSVSVGTYCDEVITNSFQCIWDVYRKDIDGTGLVFVDYIINQGTQGIWSYRQWATGKLECWCNYTASGTVEDTWGGTLWTGLHSDFGDYPIAFTDNPTVLVNVIASNYNGWVATLGDTVASATRPQDVQFVRPAQVTATTSVTYSLYAIGKWKE